LLLAVDPPFFIAVRVSDGRSALTMPNAIKEPALSKAFFDASWAVDSMKGLAIIKVSASIDPNGIKIYLSDR
jgi:hypothetical protein